MAELKNRTGMLFKCLPSAVVQRTSQNGIGSSTRYSGQIELELENTLAVHHSLW